MSVKSELNESTNNEQSGIKNFYEGLNVFVTGGSGFLGILLIQKLLREFPNMCKMYLLVRPKKGRSPGERLDRMFQDPVFDKMKLECPNYRNIIQIVIGDLQKPNLDLNEEDMKCLSKEVDVIFHLGATVRFDENIKKAALINLGGTKELIKLAKTNTNLKAFVYCSTAYSNYPRDEIDEMIYDAPYSSDKLLQIVNILNDGELECLTEKILSTWPNTYTFTKTLAENIIREEGKDMPITIVRPGIVTPTVSDPLEGWINNLNGPIGISCAIVYGVSRVIQVDKDVLCNYVPGDYVVNNLIVAAQYIGTTSNKERLEAIKSVNNIPIFNCVSQTENPLSYEEFQESVYTCVRWAPLDALWFMVFIYCANPYLLKVIQLFLEIIPAYLIDFLLVIRGKNAKMVKTVRKVQSQFNLITPFTLKSWIFLNYNNQELWNRLNTTDKRIFPFSMKNIDWTLYMLEQYSKGVYLYCLKLPKDQTKARAKYQRLKYIHFTVMYSFYTLCALIVLKLFTVFVRTYN